MGGGGGGGGGGREQASSYFGSKHKLWNFHMYWLVLYLYQRLYCKLSCVLLCRMPKKQQGTANSSKGRDKDKKAVSRNRRVMSTEDCTVGDIDRRRQATYDHREAERGAKEEEEGKQGNRYYDRELAIKISTDNPRYGILSRRSLETDSDQEIEGAVSDLFNKRSSSRKSSAEKQVKLPTNTGVEDKLANAEKRLANEMKAKQEKKEKFKAIIEEDEIHLKLLEQQLQELEVRIKKQEDKIESMKLQRKNTKPLLKKFGTQFQIAKCVLRREKLQDDLSILKGQCASRKRRIQKYKTRIRYDLQILNDPSVATVNPSNEMVTEHKMKQERRPIPACFFAGEPLSTLNEEADLQPSRRREDLSCNSSGSLTGLYDSASRQSCSSDPNYICDALEESIAKERLGCKQSSSSIGPDNFYMQSGSGSNSTEYGFADYAVAGMNGNGGTT